MCGTINTVLLLYQQSMPLNSGFTLAGIEHGDLCSMKCAWQPHNIYIYVRVCVCSCVTFPAVNRILHTPCSHQRQHSFTAYALPAPHFKSVSVSRFTWRRRTPAGALRGCVSEPVRLLSYLRLLVACLWHILVNVDVDVHGDFWWRWSSHTHMQTANKSACVCVWQVFPSVLSFNFWSLMTDSC